MAGFDRANNNAQNDDRSPHDVVVGFQGAGNDVSHYDWTLVRDDSVAEYSDGDRDGAHTGCRGMRCTG